MNTLPLIVILGPTASGKTRRAVELARIINAEIISADSRQIYRHMDLGTGKDIEEYGDVPYHLIDICPPGYKYNLFEFLRDYKAAETDIRARGRNVVLCGGTGLYIETVLKGIELPPVPQNPELRRELETKSLDELTDILRQYKTLHNTTDVDSVKRAVRAIEIQKYYHENPQLQAAATPHPMTNVVIVGVEISRDERRNRISSRLDARIDSGMIDEVRDLIYKHGVPAEDLIYYGLEYKFLTKYVIGELTRDEMREQLEIAIHQFAKRQMTWFRGMERRGFNINWIPYDLPSEEFNERILDLCASGDYKE